MNLLKIPLGKEARTMTIRQWDRREELRGELLDLSLIHI